MNYIWQIIYGSSESWHEMFKEYNSEINCYQGIFCINFMDCTLLSNRDFFPPNTNAMQKLIGLHRKKLFHEEMS